MAASDVGPLPLELTIAILEHLGYRDVLRCRLVSREFRELVDSCSSLQYIVELAICNMDDNPHNQMTVAQKLPLLKHYAQLWSELTAPEAMRTSQKFPIYDGPAWELAGGVLAQSIQPDKIEFRQLPSLVRGIQEKTWTTQLCCSLVDFSMDPGQDLLVIVEAPFFRRGYARLLSMTSGQRHPLAAQMEFEFTFEGARPSYEIKICGTYVGLLVRSSHVTPNVGPEHYVRVWNWKDGTEKYREELPYLSSFVFVDEHRIVVAKDMSPGSKESAALHLVNLSSGSREGKLYLPPLEHENAVEGLELISEPSAMWVPPLQDPPPFQVSQRQRLIVLMLNVAYFTTISFALLSSDLREAANIHGQSYPDGVPWDVWGEARCRAHCTTHWDGLWPCVVYGTKQIFLEPIDADGDDVAMNIIIRDYNQNAIRYSLTHSEPDARHHRLLTQAASLYSEPTNLGFFANNIDTTLPYREFRLPSNLSVHCDIMISEDSIVAVKGDAIDVYGFETFSL